MSQESNASSGPVRVFVGGTFDGLHAGHLFLFEFARKQATRLARKLGRKGVHLSVTIARDESVRRIKGRSPLHRQEERKKLVGSLRQVDEAFVGQAADFTRSIRRARPDLIVLGHDQSAAWEEILRRSGFDIPVMRCPEYGRRRLKTSMFRTDLARRPT